MEKTRVAFGVCFVLLLILTSGMAMETEAIFRHKCRKPSIRFKGICVVNRNCNAVCQGEGYIAGECEGARRRCLCSIQC